MESLELDIRGSYGKEATNGVRSLPVNSRALAALTSDVRGWDKTASGLIYSRGHCCSRQSLKRRSEDKVSPATRKKPSAFCSTCWILFSEREVKMKKEPLIPLEEYEEMAESYMGFCLNCKQWTSDSCEPDARNYSCPECQERKVFGAEECLMMGLVG